MNAKKEISDAQGISWLRRFFRDNPWLWVVLYGTLSTGFLTKGQQVVGWLAEPAIKEAVAKADSSGKAALAQTKGEILDSIGKMIRKPQDIAYQPNSYGPHAPHDWSNHSLANNWHGRRLP